MKTSFAVAFLLALLLGATASGEATDLVGRRLDPKPGLLSGGRFGAAVAISGNVIAVGAYLSDLGGHYSGAVYLFRQNKEIWTFFQVIPGDSGEQLGFDLAFDPAGNRLLVGAPLARNGNVPCGAVYQYAPDENGNYTKLGPIPLPDACQEGAEIGSAVAAEDGIRVIGARGAAGRMGRIYASFNGGRFELLTAPGAGVGDELGQSVSTDGQMIVAGAPFSDFHGSESGAIYIFKGGSRTGTRLTPDTLHSGDTFGYAVAVKNGLIAAGAPLSDVRGGDSGTVYLRKDEGPWIQLDGKEGEQLGVSLALTEERGYAGARRASGSAGAVYPFDPLNPLSGLGMAMLSPCPESGPEPGAEFGFSVATRGSILVVGAFLEKNAGAAYVFAPGTKSTLELSESQSVSESAGKVLFIMKLTSAPACGPLELTVSTQENTATKKSDFVLDPEPQKVTLSADSLDKTIEVFIHQDALCEGPETFSVLVSDPSSSSQKQQVTIDDDDLLSLVLTPSPLRLEESVGQAVLSVSLSCPPKAPVTVTLRPAKGSVSPPHLRFTAGNWNQRRTVLVKEDSLLNDKRCGSNPPYPLVATATFLSQPVTSSSVRVVRINDDHRCISGTQNVCVLTDGTILYTIELSNAGDLTQEDLPSDEYVVEMPDKVTVLWASADRGLATVDYVGNSIIWNGSIPPGSGTVRIEMIASAPLATPVAVQGTLTFDREGDGTLDTAETNPAGLCTFSVITPRSP